MKTPHGTILRFWGGPSDGAQIEEPTERRCAAPVEWWIDEGQGYRMCGLVRHRGDDASVCAVTYVWREVWDE